MDAAWLAPLAALAGVFFGLIGVAYRLGQARGVPARSIALVLFAAGALFFGLRSLGQHWHEAPRYVFLLGVGVGASQYLMARLLPVALALGPLSPLWCAVCLSFLLAVAYDCLFLGQTIGPFEAAAVLAAAGSVVFGSLQQHDGGEGKPVSLAGRAIYGGLLFLMLALNSVVLIAIKDLAARAAPSGVPLAEAYGNVFFTLFYASGGAVLAVDLAASGGLGAPVLRTLAVGLLAAGGSVAGMSLLIVCAVLPAAVVFTLSHVLSILTAGLVSVVFFRERAGPAWWAMMALGVVSLVLVNATAFGTR